MPTLIDRLRHGAENIHSIGAGRAADLLREAAAAIEELQRAQPPASEPFVSELPPVVRARIEAWIRETLKGPPDPSWKTTSAFKCSCPRGCDDRLEMRIFHGTPEQFIAALSGAGDSLSFAERDAAAARYCDEWAAAPEGPRELTLAIHAQLCEMGCDVHSATQAEFKLAWEKVEKRLLGPRADSDIQTYLEQVDRDILAAKPEDRTKILLEDLKAHMQALANDQEPGRFPDRAPSEPEYRDDGSKRTEADDDAAQFAQDLMDEVPVE